MARYIDAEKIISELETNIYNSKNPTIRLLDVFEIVENMPTEDVVPRSEVDQAKQEVAREIFEEIENCRTIGIYGVIGFLIEDIAKLKKKYIGE